MTASLIHDWFREGAAALHELGTSRGVDRRESTRQRAALALASRAALNRLCEGLGPHFRDREVASLSAEENGRLVQAFAKFWNAHRPRAAAGASTHLATSGPRESRVERAVKRAAEINAASPRSPSTSQDRIAHAKRRAAEILRAGSRGGEPTAAPPPALRRALGKKPAPATLECRIAHAKRRAAEINAAGGQAPSPPGA